MFLSLHYYCVLPHVFIFSIFISFSFRIIIIFIICMFIFHLFFALEGGGSTRDAFFPGKRALRWVPVLLLRPTFVSLEVIVLRRLPQPLHCCCSSGCPMTTSGPGAFTFPSLRLFKTLGSNCVIKHCTFHSIPALAVVRDGSLVLCGDGKTTLASWSLTALPDFTVLSDVHPSRARNSSSYPPSPPARGSVGNGTPAGNGVLGMLTVIVGPRRLRSNGSSFTLKRRSTSQVLSSGSSLIARAASTPSGAPTASLFAP